MKENLGGKVQMYAVFFSSFQLLGSPGVYLIVVGLCWLLFYRVTDSWCMFQGQISGLKVITGLGLVLYYEGNFLFVARK